MKPHRHMREFIKRVSGQDNILTIPRIYMELTNDMNMALVLNQSIYYSGITKRKDGFFYKSYLEWTDEIYLSKYQVKNAVDKLKSLGLMETKLRKANGSPTIHYKVCMESLEQSIVKLLHFGKSTYFTVESKETSLSLTESSTESSTKKDTYDKSNILKVYKHWNSKGIIKHREMTSAMESGIRARLRKYDIEEVKKTIDNYNKILTNEKYYYTHKFSLQDFMRPSNFVKFSDDAKPLDNYIDKKLKAKKQPAGGIDKDEFNLDD